MVATSHDPMTLTRGHIAVYARDARWRRAMAKSLTEAGHTHHEAASPEDIHRLLASQRFDVLTLKVRDEQDARELAEVLEGVALPLHSILVGDASVLPLTPRPRHGGTFRYVPGPLPARDLTRLVEASINAGTCEEGTTDNVAIALIEEVDLEEAIETAATAVYAQAKRKRQRFVTIVEGPVAYALAEPRRLRRTLVALLKFIVAHAPRGASVSVEARAGRDDWLIRVRASTGEGAAAGPAELADGAGEETQTLIDAAREVQRQGGLFWLELLGPATSALCLTLPLPAGAKQSALA